ncbi:hypothetical protein CEP52_002017 [Fusarium oligoseptatum]|uniref:Uncharacterized protein n=1 Tax=Fusarium oligoseptatum TaxID=2604345 RepID=A0A428UFW8_9HYPO|nr:hypothetical protein CEP52_002017 [Fusarium oligoseptatum]
MAPFRDNVSKILRPLRLCLGRSNGALGPLLFDSTKMLLLFHPTRDMSALWRRRLTAIATSVLDFGWVVIIYLMSELIIWGLSRALAPAHLEFFFFHLWYGFDFCPYGFGLSLLSERRRDVPKTHQSKDFINVHLGLGFPIPLVMLNQSDILGGHDIACIIGNFVVTNLVSWTTVFAISLLVMSLATSRIPDEFCIPSPLTTTPPRVEISWLSSDSTLDQISRPACSNHEKERRLLDTGT